MAMVVDDRKAVMKSSYGAAAQGWDRWFEWYERNFHPSIAWCCDAAGVGPGATILDLGCGTGQPALPLARRVQPGGRVVATDLAPEMLDVARRRAERAGLKNIEFRDMDAEYLDFQDQTFDAVTFAYGLMFCPDAGRVVAEIHSVLKPHGRFVAVVWDDRAKSPFVTTAGQAVAQFFPAQPPDPNVPGVFRFAKPGTFDDLLRTAGFVDVSVESRPMTLECASPAEYWAMFTDHAAGIKAKLAQLSEVDFATLTAKVESAADRYPDGDKIRLVATPLCARAVRPA